MEKCLPCLVSPTLKCGMCFKWMCEEHMYIFRPKDVLTFLIRCERCYSKTVGIEERRQKRLEKRKRGYAK